MTYGQMEAGVAHHFAISTSAEILNFPLRATMVAHCGPMV
jgi:hypothetical protein